MAGNIGYDSTQRADAQLSMAGNRHPVFSAILDACQPGMAAPLSNDAVSIMPTQQNYQFVARKITR